LFIVRQKKTLDRLECRDVDTEFARREAVPRPLRDSVVSSNERAVWNTLAAHLRERTGDYKVLREQYEVLKGPASAIEPTQCEVILQRGDNEVAFRQRLLIARTQPRRLVRNRDRRNEFLTQHGSWR
jgi:hypothetical protein